MVNLGDKVKDTITGFVGIAVARTEWITGCNRIAIQPQVDKDGKLPETVSFDEPNVIVLKATKVKAKADREIGGPRPNAVAKPTPKKGLM